MIDLSVPIAVSWSMQLYMHVVTNPQIKIILTVFHSSFTKSATITPKYSNLAPCRVYTSNWNHNPRGYYHIMVKVCQGKYIETQVVLSFILIKNIIFVQYITEMVTVHFACRNKDCYSQKFHPQVLILLDKHTLIHLL